MATPVVAVSSAPTYGGLTGYKRSLLGKPTQVPSNLPAFRGRNATPGGEVRAPAIQNSKNRNDRGTNVAIPYARICPIDHTQDLGRIARGDVCFVSRTQVTTYHVNMSRQERVVGLDFLNRTLGNNMSQVPQGMVAHPNWSVGRTVLLGARTKTGTGTKSFGNVIADNWREATVLRDFVLDGIVMSNDEPHAHVSNGTNDVQQFNICVQGPTTVNNGFVDWMGQGVEAGPRSVNERHGYGREGRVAIGGTPYYQSFPMQMFDRKVMPLSTLYVGLIATKRKLTPQMKKELLKNSPHLLPGMVDYDVLDPSSSDPDNPDTFYTFKFVCFSDRAARQGGGDFSIHKPDDWKYAEPPSKKQRPVHKDDVESGDRNFDPYEPMSVTEYRGMVGAWKVGRVLDTAASRRDTYSGGPIDTAQQLTVNVCLEWMDWRALRRTLGRTDICMYVSGAPPWALPGYKVVPDPSSNGLIMQSTSDASLKKNVPFDTKMGPTIQPTRWEVDTGVVFQWPTAYMSRDDLPKPTMDQDGNIPVDPTSSTKMDKQKKDYKKRKVSLVDVKGVSTAKPPTSTPPSTPPPPSSADPSSASTPPPSTPPPPSSAPSSAAPSGTNLTPSPDEEKRLDEIRQRRVEFKAGKEDVTVEDAKSAAVNILTKMGKTVDDTINLRDADVKKSLINAILEFRDTGETPDKEARRLNAKVVFGKPPQGRTTKQSATRAATVLADGVLAIQDIFKLSFVDAFVKYATEEAKKVPDMPQGPPPVSSSAAENLVGGKGMDVESDYGDSDDEESNVAAAVVSSSAAQSGAAEAAEAAAQSAQSAPAVGAASSNSSDLFSAIFGSTPSGTATAASPSAAETRSPSSGNPKQRIRRAREGR